MENYSTKEIGEERLSIGKGTTNDKIEACVILQNWHRQHLYQKRVVINDKARSKTRYL